MKIDYNRTYHTRINIAVIILIMLSSSGAFGQTTFDLEGSVIGSEEETLPSATVVVLSSQDSTLVSFALTNNEGKFKVPELSTGAYILQITFLGYEQYSEKLTINEGFNPDLQTIQLLPSNTLLEQVEIKGEHTPLVVKKDTLEYNAAAFQTQPNEVVEDLLKKLPGVEVDSDGTITAQGEEVENVTVDGKKFFGDDPTIATRNLPADAIDKIQIFDQKSDMAEFSGVDDGEREKTINLELKEDRRKGQFGTVEAGYGTDDRYKGRLSLNRFSSKTQISAIGNFNNVNEQGFSSGDFNNFQQGLGFGRGGNNSLVNSGLSNGFVTTNAGGVNINHDFTSKIDMSVSYFLNDISNKTESTLSRETFGDSFSFFDEESASSNQSSTNHKLNAELNIEIDSSQNLALRSNLVFNTGESIYSGFSTRLDETKLIQNSSLQDNNTTGNSFDATGRATYRKKFGKVKKRVFTLQGNINDSTSDSDGSLRSENIFFDDTGMINFIDDIVQVQEQNDNATSYRIESSFVEPLSSNTFLELKYRRQNFNNELRRVVEDVVSGDLIFNDDLSNHYQRDYVYDRGSLTWHMNGEKTSLSVEAAAQQSRLNGNIISEGILIENNVFRILPRINFRQELGQSQNIRIRYSTSVNEPSITQLQPVPDNSNPINIYVGNPNLIPEYTHTLRLNYINFDQFSSRSFFAFINARYTFNNITNQTILDPDFIQITQPVNVDYDFNLSGNLSFSTPLKFLRTRLRIGSRLSYQNSLVFINGIENVRNRITPSVNVKLENRNKKTFGWEIGGNYNLNRTTYDLSDRNQNFNNKGLTADLDYNFKQSWSISTDIDVNFYSAEQVGEASTVPIWSASLSKYALKNQGLEIKLTVFDILNQNIGISQRNGLNFIENSEITSLSQYGMLSFIYAIKGGIMASGGQGTGGGGGRSRSGRR